MHRLWLATFKKNWQPNISDFITQVCFLCLPHDMDSGKQRQHYPVCMCLCTSPVIWGLFCFTAHPNSTWFPRYRLIERHNDYEVHTEHVTDLRSLTLEQETGMGSDGSDSIKVK